MFNSLDNFYFLTSKSLSIACKAKLHVRKFFHKSLLNLACFWFTRLRHSTIFWVKKFFLGGESGVKNYISTQFSKLFIDRKTLAMIFKKALNRMLYKNDYKHSELGCLLIFPWRRFFVIESSSLLLKFSGSVSAVSNTNNFIQISR